MLQPFAHQLSCVWPTMSLEHPSKGAGATVGGGVPKPGAFVTPQARGQEKKREVHPFFDPSTYRGRVAGLPPMAPAEPMTDLTPANIKNFFDPDTYHGKIMVFAPMCTTVSRVGLTRKDINEFFDPSSYHPQKRPAESAPTHPAAKARMGKLELLEKFKLAAELNGVSWNELVVPYPSVRHCFLSGSWSNDLFLLMGISQNRGARNPSN